MKRISVLVLLGLIVLCSYGMVWAEVIEIDFWHIWTGDRLYLVDEVISRFEALYPGIKVNAQLIGNSDLILRDKLVTGSRWLPRCGDDRGISVWSWACTMVCWICVLS